MQFNIIENEDGTFALQKFEPVLVGTFPDRGVAQKVLDFLVEEAMDELSEMTPKIIGFDGTTKPSERARRDAATAEAVQPDGAEPETEPTAEGPGPDYQEDWTDAEVTSAFAELEQGHPLKIVAEQYGKNWRVLRAKWAAEKKRRAADAAPDEDDREECRLCGRPFRPTPERMDICSRCDV